MSYQNCALLIITLIFVIFTHEVSAANILVYSPSSGPSHFKPFQPLFVALAKRGHNVTVLSKFPPEERIATYKHFQISEVFSVPKNGYAFLRQQSRIENYVFMTNMVRECSIALIDDPTTRFIFQSQSKFDLIMIELYHGDVYFALSDHFNAPIIGLSFQPILSVYNWIIKNPMELSYIPNLYSPFKDDMNFIERAMNALFGVFTVLYYHVVSLPAHQSGINALMKSLNIDKVPNIEQVTSNLSLILVESHFSVDYPKPNLPNVVEVAGVHISSPKPLPQDIEEFIQGAENGVIYVSMGTLILPDSMNDFGQKLISIFQQLPYRIIWKWNPDLVKSPPNILIRKWLPQVDILRHPNVKLFISHGGYHGILESVNGAVPILCFPFFTDQYHNAAIIEKYNFGMKEQLEASEKEIFDKIRELLSNKKYAENAKKHSIIFKDRPRHPLDEAIYWTEYVIRHKGAPHLKSAAVQLRWYEYLLLDVIACGLLTLVMIFCIVRLVFKILRKLCSRKASNKIKSS